jgi:protein tyrosine phosphatase (PTP) superfamily phosphohydrolase (DUF442 family)
MKITRKRLIIALTLIVMLLGWLWYDHFIEDGNFAIHTPNEVYRSGTLSAHEWKEVRHKHPFNSVINLRGTSEGAEWFERESSAAKHNEVNFYTFGISANSKPSLQDMEVLVEMMRAAPKPLLIHCKSGSDRTGLALALYSYAIQGQPAEEAAKQLSVRYGHFPWLTSRTGAMDAAFAEYVAAHPQAPIQKAP